MHRTVFHMNLYLLSGRHNYIEPHFAMLLKREKKLEKKRNLGDSTEIRLKLGISVSSKKKDHHQFKFTFCVVHSPHDERMRTFSVEK